MQLNITFAEFRSALAQVDRVRLARTPRPILSCALLTVSDGHASIAATDSEIGLQVTLTPLDGRGAEDGSIAFNPEGLGGLAGELLEITSDQEGARVTFTTESATVTIGYLDALDWPHVPWPEEEPDVAVAKDAFIDSVEAVSHALSKEKTRYALTGALLTLSPEGHQAACTDGKRLALCAIPAELPVAEPISFLAPGKAIKAISGLRALEGDDIRLALLEPAGDDGRAKFLYVAHGYVRLLAKCVDGTFPNYKEVIPESGFSGEGPLPAGLLDAARQVKPWQTEMEEDGRVELKCEAEKIIVHSTNAEGDATVTVDAPGCPDFEALLNPDFITDALAGADDLHLAFLAPDRPFRIRSTDGRYTAVLMPCSKTK